jgi:ribosomal protein S18 acetylase RimI-like enzyme
VIPENEGAKKFYEQIGFEATGEMHDGEFEYIYHL